jgi:hypothetical protein
VVDVDDELIGVTGNADSQPATFQALSHECGHVGFSFIVAGNRCKHFKRIAVLP